ncbi:MAG: hypothetical protein AB1689_17290 [Thermodesulfobacteriota bacterium]
MAFRRIAAALHACSGREEMVLVDLRRSSGTLPAGLPNGARGTRTTLCLDGIEHLGPSGQEAFADQITRSHYRLVSATDATLDELRSRWRPDLFALVSTVTVRAPALARRAAEIPALARERIALLCRELQREVPALTAAAEAALAAHPWRGDTPELDAVLVRTLLANDGPTIDADQLPWEPDAVLALGAAPAAHVAATPAAAGEPAATPAEAKEAAELAATPPEAKGVAREEARGQAATVPSPTVEALAVELAHQLKNPLVTVKTFVASVDALSEDPHELGQFRVLTEEAVARMDEILDGLLAFARLAPPSPTGVDALSLVRDALRATWRVFASKQVTLEAPQGATLQVVTDVEHVRFALGALARHVAETIEARGTLRIEVDPQGALRFAYRESGAITHLRGATTASDSGLPLALLLVRGALGRVGGDVEITVEDTAVLILIRLAAP